MKIYFKSRKLQKTLSSERAIKQTYGKNAKIIMRRLKEIQTVNNLAVLFRMPGKHHPLDGDRKGQFACWLTGNDRLIYKPVDAPLPLDEQGTLIYREVKSVVIVEIEDYH